MIMNTKQLLKMIKTTINHVLPCNDLNGFEIAINTGYEIAKCFEMARLRNDRNCY